MLAEQLDEPAGVVGVAVRDSNERDACARGAASVVHGVADVDQGGLRVACLDLPEALRIGFAADNVFGDDGDFLGLGAPNLTRWGSRRWLTGQIAHPDAPEQYGELNDMPSFADQLSAHDIEMVTAFLRRQRFEEIDF